VVTEDDAVCLEMCPDGVAVLRPQSGWLVHANHFLDPVLAEGERVMFDLTTTLERQELLSARSKAVDEPLDAEGLARLLAAHDEDGVAVCRHVDRQAPMGYRTATLATVALDPAARSAAVSAGGPGERRDVVTLTATP
jgi:isopenicillin-N N-acyltransferase-like protein